MIMNRNAVILLLMSLTCLLVFTVSSIGCSESEFSSVDNTSVFMPIIEEYRAVIHDPHYDSDFKDSFFLI